LWGHVRQEKLLLPKSFPPPLRIISISIEAKLSDTKPSQVLKKFQSVLKKPAVQLVEKSEGYHMIPNGDQYILVAPAYQWLSGLP